VSIGHPIVGDLTLSRLPLLVQSGYLLAWARACSSPLGAAVSAAPYPKVDPDLLGVAPLGPQTAIPSHQGRDVEGYSCTNTRGARMLPSKTVAEEHVKMMLTVGAAFGEIEGYIDETSLRDHQKSALWLIAWSEQERSVQRRVAHEALVLS
jgi:hypothetical protein